MEIVERAVYVELFHGRENPDAPDENPYGRQGPIIGPFEAVHGIYCGANIRVAPINGDDPYFLKLYDGMIAYDGWLYPDYWIISGEMLLSEKYRKYWDRVEEFDPEKCKLPEHLEVFEAL
jgi:hypothetical protein